MNNKTKLLLALPLTLLALGVSACSGSDDGDSGDGGSGLSGQMAGAGASSQEAAMNGWIVSFQDKNPDVTISYDPVGSGGGREQFIAGGTSFGGTDSAMDDDELAAVAKRCGAINNYIEMPAYISPIAVAYNVDGVEELNLAPSTLAQVMSGKIENWNDPAIAADNPDADLPDTRITVVHRSDESGTTENFADYLSQAAPKDWKYDVDGYWPIKGGEAAQGTSGVISAINAGSGTIGYADLSQVGELGTVNVKVGDSFVAPSAEAAAQIVDVSEQIESEGKFVFAYDLKRDTDADGIYPISLVSYEMACTQYDSAEEAELVKAFYSFIISEEGQQAAAEAAGSAPISDQLREKISPAVEAIGAS